MNQQIKEELKKCITPIPEYSNNDTEIIIPRYGDQLSFPTTNEDFIVGNVYLVKVNKSLVYPCDWYYTIHSNWNNGKGPTEEMLYIKVMSKAGKMINVAAAGYSNKTTWYGWLPQTNLTILERR